MYFAYPFCPSREDAHVSSTLDSYGRALRGHLFHSIALLPQGEVVPLWLDLVHPVSAGGLYSCAQRPGGAKRINYRGFQTPLPRTMVSRLWWRRNRGSRGPRAVGCAEVGSQVYDAILGECLSYFGLVRQDVLRHL